MNITRSPSTSEYVAISLLSISRDVLEISLEVGIPNFVMVETEVSVLAEKITTVCFILNSINLGKSSYLLPKKNYVHFTIRHFFL